MRQVVEALRLAINHGRSHREIARALGVSQSTKDNKSLRRLLPSHTAKAAITARFTMEFMRPFFRPLWRAPILSACTIRRRRNSSPSRY